MCSINFSNTGTGFREQVAKVAGDKVITQAEITGLEKVAATDSEKNFVSSLQSKANFQELKLSSFDPAKSTISFDLPEKPKEVQEPAFTKTKSTEQVQQTQEKKSNPVNLLIPLLGAIAIIMGAFAKAAHSPELNEAVNKSIEEATKNINKIGNTPIERKVPEEDKLARNKKLLEGK